MTGPISTLQRVFEFQGLGQYSVHIPTQTQWYFSTSVALTVRCRIRLLFISKHELPWNALQYFVTGSCSAQQCLYNVLLMPCICSRLAAIFPYSPHEDIGLDQSELIVEIGNSKRSGQDSERRETRRTRTQTRPSFEQLINIKFSPVSTDYTQTATHWEYYTGSVQH